MCICGLVNHTQNHDQEALRTPGDRFQIRIGTYYRLLKVNALLDDASTKTYVNSDVAAQLGLQGKTERVTVNVLNGQVETFETRPVNVELESLTGEVKLGVTAYTATRVVGTMTAFDWTEYTQRWSHLRHISFPSIAKRPVVDVLIGLDCADLHFAIQEVLGSRSLD